MHPLSSSPGRCSKTLIRIKRIARAIVLLARFPGLSRLSVQFKSIFLRIGPLTNISTPVELVTEDNSWMQLGSCLKRARIAPKTIGKCSAKQPAITELAAACSARRERFLTGTTPNISFGSIPAKSSNAATRSGVGGTTGNPSVQPLA